MDTWFHVDYNLLVISQITISSTLNVIISFEQRDNEMRYNVTNFFIFLRLLLNCSPKLLNVQILISGEFVRDFAIFLAAIYKTGKYLQEREISSDFSVRKRHWSTALTAVSVVLPSFIFFSPTFFEYNCSFHFSSFYFNIFTDYFRKNSPLSMSGWNHVEIVRKRRLRIL